MAIEYLTSAADSPDSDDERAGLGYNPFPEKVIGNPLYNNPHSDREMVCFVK